MRRTLQNIPSHVAFTPTSRIQLITPTFRSRPAPLQCFQCLHTSPRFREENKDQKTEEKKEKDEQEHSIKKGTLDEAIGKAKEKQARTPWHREGSDQPPVKRDRQASAMTKGSFFPFTVNIQTTVTSNYCITK